MVDRLDLVRLITLLYWTPQFTEILGHMQSKIAGIIDPMVTGSRQLISDLKEALHEQGYEPVLLHYRHMLDKEEQPDPMPALHLLFKLARFVLIDLTHSEGEHVANMLTSVKEVLPRFPQVPAQFLVSAEHERERLFADFSRFSTVLYPYRYLQDQRSPTVLQQQVIVPAEQKATELFHKE